jgi:hypothetical protein
MREETNGASDSQIVAEKDALKAQLEAANDREAALKAKLEKLKKKGNSSRSVPVNAKKSPSITYK